MHRDVILLRLSTLPELLVAESGLVIRVTLRFDDSIVFPCSFARGCESFGGVVGFGNYKL